MILYRVKKKKIIYADGFLSVIVFLVVNSMKLRYTAFMHWIQYLTVRSNGAIFGV